MNSQVNVNRAKIYSSDAKHRYRVSAWRTADGAGLAKCELAPNALHFAAPPEFGGLKGRWTPETLLLAAVAGCFTTTFQAIAGYSKLEYTDLEVEVEGIISKSNSGYAFTAISISPVLTIPEATDQKRALELLRRVQALCLVSRALALEEKFEPKVETVELAAV